MIFYDFFKCILLNFGAFFITFLLWKIFLIICLCYNLLCRRGNRDFDIQFRSIRPVYFPWKDGKDAVCKERNGGKVVFFPPESAYFLCNYYDQSIFPYFVSLLGV